MKIGLTILLFFLALLPYLALFYKEVNIRIRLLFASLFEIIIFFTSFIVINNTIIPLTIEFAHTYEIIFLIIISFNLFIILMTWIMDRWGRK